MLTKRRNWSTALWTVLILVALVVVIPNIYYAITFANDRDFSIGFVANLASTLLGAIVGIPIALALNRLVQREQERIEEGRAKDERLARERFILSVLRDELETNKTTLEALIPMHDKQPSRLSITGMKDVNWQAFSDGGELKWIDNLNILLCVSDAYFYIDTLIYLERQYTDVSDTPNISLIPRERSVLLRVHKLRPLALEYINKAITAIDARGNILKTTATFLPLDEHSTLHDKKSVS